MFCSVAARLWLRAVSATVVSANGYNTTNGYNAGSDLSEQLLCESVAPTARQ